MTVYLRRDSSLVDRDPARLSIEDYHTCVHRQKWSWISKEAMLFAVKRIMRMQGFQNREGLATLTKRMIEFRQSKPAIQEYFDQCDAIIKQGLAFKNELVKSNGFQLRTLAASKSGAAGNRTEFFRFRASSGMVLVFYRSKEMHKEFDIEMEFPSR